MKAKDAAINCAKVAQEQIEKLTERCEGYKGQVEYGAAEIARLKTALTESRGDALRYLEEMRRCEAQRDQLKRDLAAAQITINSLREQVKLRY